MLRVPRTFPCPGSGRVGCAGRSSDPLVGTVDERRGGGSCGQALRRLSMPLWAVRSIHADYKVHGPHLEGRLGRASQMVEADPHTAFGLKRRHRKGLDPLRRLSETPGPLHLSAFRVVVRAAEVTKRGARCRRPAAILTRGAPQYVRLPQCTSCGAHVPHSRGDRARNFPERNCRRCWRRCAGQ